MADILTPEKRSAVVALICGRDTKPELALRSLLHRAVYRFTLCGPLNRSLPGRPDFVLPKYRTSTQITPLAQLHSPSPLRALMRLVRDFIACRGTLS